MVQTSPCRVRECVARSGRCEGVLLAVVLLAVLGGGATIWWMDQRESNALKLAEEADSAVDFTAKLQEAEERADTLDPGWRFVDLQGRRPQIPDAKNGALAVLDAGKTLTVP